MKALQVLIILGIAIPAYSNQKPTIILSDDCKQALAALGPGEGWIYLEDIQKRVRKEGARTDAFGRWICPSCGNEDTFKPKPTQKVVCTNCPQSIEEGVESIVYTVDGRKVFHKDDLAASKEDIEAAKSGFKWFCPYCKTGNQANHASCGNCGAAVEEGKRIKIPTVYKELPPERIGRKASDPPLHPAKEEFDVIDWAEKHRNKLMVAGGAAIATLAGAILWGRGGEKIEGQVTEMNWEHSHTLQRFVQTSGSGWASELKEQAPVMPVKGKGEIAGIFDIRNCRPKFHHNRQELDHYETKRVWVPDPPPPPPPSQDWGGGSDFGGGGGGGGFHDSGNGSYGIDLLGKNKGPQLPAELKWLTEQQGSLKAWETRQVPVYRDVPVYRSYCDYSTYAWQTISRSAESGKEPPAGGDLPWPKTVAGDLERVVAESTYSVTFEYERKGKRLEHEEKPKTESEFRSWKIGGKGILSVRRVGGKILGVRHPD